MSPAQRALLDRIIEDPDDLDTRMVFGDALGNERGEAIAIAAELARARIVEIDDLVHAPIVGDELVRRATQLRVLALRDLQCRDGWLGDAGIEPDERAGITLRAGFVDALEVGDDTVDRLGRVLAIAPLRHLVIRTWTPKTLAAIARLPIARLRNVTFEGFPSGAPQLAALLAALPNLTGLAFRERIEPADVAMFADHAQLVALDIAKPTDASIGALCACPLATRLRELSLYRIDQSWDTRPIVLDDPLRVLAGAFPALVKARLNWLGLTDAMFARRDLVFPPVLALTSDRWTGAALRAMAPALAGVRQLEIAGAQVDDISLSTLARAAPKLERLAMGYDLVSDRGLRALAPLPLRRLQIFHAAASAAGIARVAAEHDLEELVVHARVGAPLAAELVEHLVAMPRAASLRALSIDHSAIDERAAGLLATLANLRRLALRWTRPLGAGVDALARLPALVDLELIECAARPTPALAAHPTLVRLAIDPYGEAATRRVLRRRFGREPERRHDVVLLTDRVVTDDDLALVLVGAERNELAFEIADTWISIAPDVAKYRTLAALLSPTPLAAITAILISALTEDVAALLPVARTLRTAFGGTIWNAHDDILVDV